MKDSTRILILSVFSIIWICKPIPYETVSYRQYVLHQHQKTVNKVLEIPYSGGRESTSNSFKKEKIDLSFHRRLKQHFPDWNERMDYQKKQEKFYKLAMKRKKELKRLRVLDKKSYYTKEELDAMNYFQGTGFYITYQDPKVKPNIFDTRQSFLLKMHDDKLRNEFLDSFNRRNN